MPYKNREEGLAKRRAWWSAHKEELRGYRRDYATAHGILPMSENRNCASYLGVHVAERVLAGLFDHVERMPVNNPAFDFICGKGFKIDVKSSCLIGGFRRNPRWQFDIRRNAVPDYFLCLAFDNRESLTPMHVWLIPGKEINHLQALSFSSHPNAIVKWAKHEKSIDRVVAGCNAIRGVAEC